MPKFYYKARTKGGALVQGEIEAADPWLARKALIAQGLIVVEINRFGIQAIVNALKELAERFKTKVTLEERLVLINQLETGISIGIPILQVLSFVQEQMINPYIKDALGKIEEDVAQGSTLHQAFAKHPVIFDSLALSMIRTGEVTGELDGTMTRLGAIIEQQVKNRAKIRSATFYPKIVVAFMFVVITVLVTFVIPKFKAFLKTLGQNLPWITQFVLDTSDFFIKYWYLIFAIIFGLYYAFKAYVATERGRLNVDRLKLKLPRLGSLFLDMELNNYCVLLDLLLASGVPLFESFTTLRDTQTNQVIRNEIERCSGEIASGGTLGAALKKAEAFPPVFKSMIAVGEESGRLPSVLQKLGKYYQIQIDFKLDTLSRLIEPILLSIIFVIVGILAFAVFLPIWKMQASIH